MRYLIVSLCLLATVSGISSANITCHANKTIMAKLLKCLNNTDVNVCMKSVQESIESCLGALCDDNQVGNLYRICKLVVKKVNGTENVCRLLMETLYYKKCIKNSKCANEVKNRFWKCVNTTKLTPHKCMNQEIRWGKSNCLKKNATCLDNANILYGICYNILEGSKFERNGEICKRYSQTFYIKCIPTPPCTTKVIKKFKKCMKMRGIEGGRICGAQAQRFMVDKCLNKNTSCEVQSKELFTTCFKIIPNGRLCAGASRQYYMKCSNSSASPLKCAMTVNGIHKDCLKYDDWKHCDEEAKELAIRNCLSKGDCQEKLNRYGFICTILRQGGIPCETMIDKSKIPECNED